MEEYSYGAKKLEISRWIRMQNSLPHDFIECYQDFMKISKTKPSYSYFYKIAVKQTEIRVIKTGGFFANMHDVVQCVLARNKNGVGLKNVIAVDEKPFNIKKLKVKKRRVNKGYKGPLTPKNIDNYKKDDTPNFYALAAITAQKGLMKVRLQENAYNTQSFNKFIRDLIFELPKSEETLYILMDNASFHSIDAENLFLSEQKNIQFIRNPKLSCFLNPIEEYFSEVHQQLLIIIRKNNNKRINKEQFMQYICESFNIANQKTDFIYRYLRACLF